MKKYNCKCKKYTWNTTIANVKHKNDKNSTQLCMDFADVCMKNADVCQKNADVCMKNAQLWQKQKHENG